MMRHSARSGAPTVAIRSAAKPALIPLLACVFIAHAWAVEINVRDTGAAGDNTTADTAAIQKAIDACSRRGGGTVLFPAGTYVCGTILLKDNVTLHLNADATLLGSTLIGDYQLVEPFKDGNGSDMGYCFIGAVDVANIGIDGPGTIDGRGKALLDARAKADRHKRPFLVRFVRCQGVRLKETRLRNSAAWTTHFFKCSDVTAEDVSIVSRGLANNDGFDIDSCRQARISKCDIDSGDDSICFKTTSPSSCRDIKVDRCTLRSDCAGIKLGTESVGDFENIQISDCRIRAAKLGGIKIFSVDGSHVQSISLSNIAMDAVNTPIFLRLGARLKTFRNGDGARPVGSMKDISIRNITATSSASTAIVISGIPGRRVENVTLDQISIRLEGAGVDPTAPATPPEKIADYPEIGMFGKVLPAYALFARHAAGLHVKDLNVALISPDSRAAKVLIDVDQQASNGVAR